MSTSGIIRTIAGTGSAGFSGDGGLAIGASLNSPRGIAVDQSGNVFFADTGNHRIRRVDSQYGNITTVTGNGVQGYSGDRGPAVGAALNAPTSVSLDGMGNLFIADSGNNRIRKFSSDGTIATVAGNGSTGLRGDGGQATSASLNNPLAVTVDQSGNFYIADYNNKRVRKVTPDGWISSLVLGSGPSFLSAPLGPYSLITDHYGNVFISDLNRNQVAEFKQSTVPSINPGGVVPLDSPAPVIQPGSWCSIYGNNLANTTASWKGDFPISLAGTTVTINDKPAYLWFVSQGQVNFQAPDDATLGVVPVLVTTPSGTVTSTVTLAEFGPSLNLFDSKYLAGVIPTPNGSGVYGNGTYDLLGPSGHFSFRTRPVKAGEILELYGVGFGPTSPPVSAGKTFTGAAPTAFLVTVRIGGDSCDRSVFRCDCCRAVSVECGGPDCW